MLLEGGAIAIIFFIVKFLEMRFVSGETLPLKALIRETAIVYLASVVGIYTLSQFRHFDMSKNSIIGGASGADPSAAGAFTANPDF